MKLRAAVFGAQRAILALSLIVSHLACDDPSVVADGGSASHDATWTDANGSQSADGSLADNGQVDQSWYEDLCKCDAQIPDAWVSSCSPVSISTREDLLQVVSALQWNSYTPPGSGALPLSSPLAVSGPITISEGELAAPPGCTAGQTCMEQIFFAKGLSSDTLPTGVTLGKQESQLPVTAYAELTLENVTIRLRAVIENVHPWTYNFIPLIRVEPDCVDACTDDGTYCDTDQLCYLNTLYCSRCLGLGTKECACHELDSPLPDGTACSYLSHTMTALCDGECQGGSCLYSGTPDAYCP